MSQKNYGKLIVCHPKLLLWAYLIYIIAKRMITCVLHMNLFFWINFNLTLYRSNKNEKKNINFCRFLQPTINIFPISTLHFHINFTQCFQCTGEMKQSKKSVKMKKKRNIVVVWNIFSGSITNKSRALASPLLLPAEYTTLQKHADMKLSYPLLFFFILHTQTLDIDRLRPQPIDDTHNR